MAKILILGAGGRLGASLTRDFSKFHQVTAWKRGDADLSAPAKVAELVRHADMDVIVNCAAMTHVDECETERHLAKVVNADAPAAIVRAAEQSGTRLIHLSTDYVFRGDQTTPYSESDTPDPISWYGETKLAAERAVLDEGKRHVVARVSWVFGPDRDCFIDKIFQAARRGELVKAVADKWSSPSYTRDIGEALQTLLTPSAPGGIYHVCNAGNCSWHDWAMETLKAAFQNGLLPHPVEIEPIKLKDLAAMKASRPVHTAMTCQKIENLLGKPMRPWQEAVAQYVRARYGSQT